VLVQSSISTENVVFDRRAFRIGTFSSSCGKSSARCRETLDSQTVPERLKFVRHSGRALFQAIWLIKAM
jgi:hypothetical protein